MPASGRWSGTALPHAWARVLLTLVPLLTLHLLAETWLDGRERETWRRFGDSVAGRLETLAVESEPDQFLSKPLYEATRRLLAETTAPASAGSVLEAVGRGLEFQMLLVDASGTPLVSHPEKLPNQYVLRKLMKALVSPTEASRAPLRRDLERPLPALFGMGKALSFFVGAKGRPIALKYQGRAARLLWDGNDRRGILLIEFEPTRELDLFERAASDLGLSGERRLAFGVRFNYGASWHCYGRTDSKTVARLWKSLERGGQLSWQGTRSWWEFRSTAAGDLVFLAVPIPNHLRQNGIWVLRALFLLLLVPGGLWLSLGGDRLGPIRRLAIALFLLTALVPTGGMALGTLLSLEGRRGVLEAQVLRSEIEALRRLDEGFQNWAYRFQRRVARVTRDPAFARMGKEFHALVAPFLAEQYGGVLRVSDVRADPLYDSHPGSGGMKALMGIFQQMAFETWAPHRLPRGGIKGDQAVELVIRQERTGFVGLSNRPRRLQLMQNGSSRLYFFWDYFPQTGLIPAFVSFFFDWDRLAELYIRSGILERSDLWETQIRFAAFDQLRRKPFPERAWYWRSLASALQQSRILKKPVTGSLQRNGRRWWFTVVSGSTLDTFGLVAFFPDAAVEARLEGLRQRIMVGMLIALAVAIALGVMISRRLLEPVAALSEGMEALRQGNYSSFVHVASHDEFGRLAEAFNALTVELKDLNVARAVQAGLLPAEYKAPPGYDLHGLSRFAGDLGGDVLECRNLPDGRILLLIGDVSGHGAASALLMAFVKAAVTLWSGGTRADPVLLAERIDRMLQELGGRRRFLAFCGGLLDPETHRLTMVSGGHPYPLLWRRRTGETIYLGRPAYPLGSRRRSHPPSALETVLEPGDRILFYTDGLIEARDSRGAVLGYDGLRNWLEKQTADSACPLLDALVAMHETRAPATEDDLTLLVLVRKEAAR